MTSLLDVELKILFNKIIEDNTKCMYAQKNLSISFR